MKRKKSTEELVAGLGKIFQSYVDSLEIDDYYGFFCAELKIAKKNRKNNELYAMSDEKIAALEKAIEEFRLVYEAEKAEAAKMPLSWHEARRVLKILEKTGDRFTPPPAPPVEH